MVTEELRYPVMLPLAVMYLQHRSEFDAFILGSQPLSEIWEHIPADSPQYVGHPAKHIEPKDQLVPLRLHGDGVPIGKGKKRTFDIISFSSMVGERGSTWETRFFLAKVVSEATTPAEDRATSTMHKIWQILSWSFGCFVKGVWPYADWTRRIFTEDYLPEAAKNAGLPLCGGYKFAVWQLSGDLDYLCNYLELRHFNSLTPCFLCGCNRSTVPWTALTADATWRSRLATMAERSNTERHILLSTPSVGVNVFHVCLDVLHLLDLGIC